MEDTSEDRFGKKISKRICIGLLAHVDAGKTTLSEAMLYCSGTINKLGRVDNKDAFLDTYELERQRGITIFSKQAVLYLNDTKVTLMDTPGHVDFSAETERTLQVLDYGVLVINGADGVQGHTLTLWRLLEKYKVPVFLFVNKMDQEGVDKESLLGELRERFGESCIDAAGTEENFFENVAMCGDEALLDSYLETGKIEDSQIQELMKQRRIFPCFFGSALKFQGIEEFVEKIERFTAGSMGSKEFGARVFKIARDEQGNRLTYLKLTGGSLKVKTLLSYGEEEKINQIRIYSGSKYEAVQEAYKGDVCAVTGLVKTYPGQGLGIEEATSIVPVLEPVLTYGIKLPQECDLTVMLKKLKELEEEEPMLQIVFQESLREIQAKVMGEVQIEVLKSMIEERFGTVVEFDAGKIVYKETITKTVEGVGHFEPLRHYAEVHLRLEPLERGSGILVGTECSEDVLDKNWQNLILTHLSEREHVGVLAGLPVTDLKITLLTGRAHLKHTEGGDFRQATYRAVRQGLMQAGSILLEPMYEFRLEVPEKMLGRGMADVEKMYGSFLVPEIKNNMAVLKGTAPAATMREYQREVTSYSKGHGKLFITMKGYAHCHNEADIIENMGYDPAGDIENPTGSVFCAHGAGFYVPWDKVKDYMHIEAKLPVTAPEQSQGGGESTQGSVWQTKERKEEEWIGTDEIDAILERTFSANSKEKLSGKKRWGEKTYVKQEVTMQSYRPKVKKESYLLVDGYNIIFAWEELSQLAKETIDGARGRLLDILSDYKGSTLGEVIVVFDAYRVEGHKTETVAYHNIHVVYTKQAETADQYIEKFAHENGKKYEVAVATSDGLEQIIILGQGCRLYSAREFYEEVERVKKTNCTEYLLQQPKSKMRILDDKSKEEIQKMLAEETPNQEVSK